MTETTDNVQELNEEDLEHVTGGRDRTIEYAYEAVKRDISLNRHMERLNNATDDATRRKESSEIEISRAGLKRANKKLEGDTPIGADFRLFSLPKGVQGPPCPGFGVSPIPLLFSPAAAGGRKRE